MVPEFEGISASDNEDGINTPKPSYAPCLRSPQIWHLDSSPLYPLSRSFSSQSTTMADTKDMKEGVPVSETADTLVSRLAAQDTTPWYKRPNLRMLYLLFFPTCIGVEMTSGYVESDIFI